jgi:hypothetical protein
MEFLPKQPTVKASADTFTGDAWYDVITRGEEPSRIRVNVVRFAPGHRHRIPRTGNFTVKGMRWRNVPGSLPG